MAQKEAVKGIQRNELKEKIDRREHMTVLETLSPEHYRHAHLPGALNMPSDRVKELAPMLVPDKRTEVITYCAGPKCHASSDAARELHELGYMSVRRYAGGKLDWAAAGLPFEHGE
jgi:rhodanese-related sulfurtransferase